MEEAHSRQTHAAFSQLALNLMAIQFHRMETEQIAESSNSISRLKFFHSFLFGGFNTIAVFITG